jgi:CHRD domain
MVHRSRLLMFAVALTLASSSAHAATLDFSTTLLGSNEVPPNASTATGSAFVELNTTAQTLFVQETFSGLIGGSAAAAHIHCCVLPGVNAVVAVPFPGFPAATSGTYTNTFDLTLAATYNSAFITAVGGTVALAEAAFIFGLEHGETYANIHDATFPTGEIRGWLEPTPLPATLSLFATGLGALGLLGWRRKRKARAGLL